MNFTDTYRAMHESLTPSPALIRKTLAQTRRPAVPLRRLAAAALAAVLLLATPALAVRTELGYALLYAVAPAAAQFFQPVRLSDTDRGVTMEVVSVHMEGSAAQAYIALSGGAVDATCDLFDSWCFHLPFDQVGHCDPVGYDEATRTALFLCTTETMDGSPIRTGGKMTFSVDRFLSSKVFTKNLEIPLDLSAYAVEAETVPSLGPESEYGCSGGSYSDEASEALWRRAPMLQPGGTLAQPVSSMVITAAGYADGLFHVQLCRGSAPQLDNHGRLWLEDGAGTPLECVYSAAFSNFAKSGTRVDFDQYAFDVSPEELENYTLYGDFATAASLTEGHWQVTFPLEEWERAAE